MRPPRASLLDSCRAGASLACVSLPVAVAAPAQSRVVVAGATPFRLGDTVVNQTITTSFDVDAAPGHPPALSHVPRDPLRPRRRPTTTTSSRPRSSRATSARRRCHRRLRAHYFSALRRCESDRSRKGRVVLHVTGPTPEIAHAFATPVTTVRIADGTLARAVRRRRDIARRIAHDVDRRRRASRRVVAPSTHIVHPHADAHVTPSTCPRRGGSVGHDTQRAGRLHRATTSASSTASATPGRAATPASARPSRSTSSASTTRADLSIFLSCYGLAPSITTVNVDGGLARHRGSRTRPPSTSRRPPSSRRARPSRSTRRPTRARARPTSTSASPTTTPRRS